MAHIETSSSITINSSIEDTFALLSDVSQHEEIFNLNGLRDYDGGAVSQGSSWVAVHGFMGQDVVTTYTIEAFDPPGRMVYKGVSPVSEMTVTWDLSESGGKTTINAHSSGEPKGILGNLGAPVIKGNFESQMNNSLARLKSMLES